MKFKKVMSVILVCGMCVGMVAGCGKNESGSESKEILVWSSATGADAESIKTVFDNYNKTDAEYKVKLVTMQADTFNKKLTTAGKSGKGVPDLAIIASESVPTYESQGMLVTWDDAIEGSDVNADSYVKSAWDVGTIDGHQYGVPATMGSWVMYYNQDLVDKYIPGALDDGIVTYEEIEKAGEAAKADGVYSTANTWGMQNYNNLYLQMGGSWTDADGKISVNNETSKAVVEEFKKLNDNGWMVPQGEDGIKLFMNQKVIFLPEGTWSLTNMQKITDFEWGETFTPQWDADHVINCSGADQFAIFKSAEERSDAKMQGMVDFMEWLQTNQLEWLRSGANAAALAMQDNEEYKEMPQTFLVNSEGRDAIRIVAGEGLTYVLSEYDVRNWDMINGNADIEQTMDEIQQIVDEKMK